MSPRIVIPLCALVVACTMAAPSSAAVTPESRAALTVQLPIAAKGLTALQAIMAAGQDITLGFAKPDDAKRAQLGTPMRVFRVQLDALKAMNDKTNPDSVLIDAQRTLFPVTVDGRVVSGLYTTRRENTWQVEEFGDAAIARATDARRRSADDFIVWIPVARIYFVGSGSGANITLTTLMDDPRFGFKAGQTLSATAALRAVARGMANYNGLPT